MLAEIIGPDILILIAVIALLFGGSQIPKLARSLGSAQREFKKGLDEGAKDDVEPAPAAKVAPVEVPPTPATEPSASTTPPSSPIEPPPGSFN